MPKQIAKIDADARADLRVRATMGNGAVARVPSRRTAVRCFAPKNLAPLRAGDHLATLCMYIHGRTI